jgi:lipopolysaccharide export system permease protein
MLIGRTLGFYFSRQFIKTIFLVFATVFTLVYTLDFVELMRRAGDAPAATTGVIAQLALFRTPAIAEQVMPFAVLFGSMAALSSAESSNWWWRGRPAFPHGSSCSPGF